MLGVVGQQCCVRLHGALERLKLAKLLDRCDWDGKLPSWTGPLSLLSSMPLSLLS